ncbi:hypothetical protein ACFLRH_01120 [Actinomycetota bacterium]
MNRTIKWRALVGPAFGLLVAAMVLAGCSSSESESTTTDAPATTATTAASTTTTATPVASSGCVACHTDEEALQVLAVEPLDMEVLSEGEG